MRTTGRGNETMILKCSEQCLPLPLSSLNIVYPTRHCHHLQNQDAFHMCFCSVQLSGVWMMQLLIPLSSSKSIMGFLGGPMVKNPPANAGDVGLIPGWGRSPGGGNGNPLQYSCLENPMDRGVWWVTVHGVMKSWTWLSIYTHTKSVKLGPSLQSALLDPEIVMQPIFLLAYGIWNCPWCTSYIFTLIRYE